MFHFQSLPGVSLGTALVLSSTFSSVRALVHSAAATIMTRTNMEEAKARKIVDYLRKTFHGDLTNK